MVICKHDREVEVESAKCSERNLSPRPPDFKSGVLTTVTLPPQSNDVTFMGGLGITWSATVRVEDGAIQSILNKLRVSPGK